MYCILVAVDLSKEVSESNLYFFWLTILIYFSKILGVEIGAKLSCVLLVS